MNEQQTKGNQNTDKIFAHAHKQGCTNTIYRAHNYTLAYYSTRQLSNATESLLWGVSFYV